MHGLFWIAFFFFSLLQYFEFAQSLNWNSFDDYQTNCVCKSREQQRNNNSPNNCLNRQVVISVDNFRTLDQPSSSVHVITSVTSNILNYASYAIAINYEFARYRNYTFQLIEEDQSIEGFDNVYDKDSRWNKVKYLLELVESNLLSSFSHNDQKNVGNEDSRYIVWLDADLIVVNFDFDMHRLFAQHPDIDIFMSKDKKDAPFVGNTGCIIVKVSSWSKLFLEKWWNTYDRKRCCDQNALTWLYDRQIPSDVHSKLLFLPAEMLNTEFPGYLSANRYDNMLHLAGMNTIFRANIYSHALQTLQDALHQVSSLPTSALLTLLPTQLGVDYHYLQSQIWSLDEHRLCALQRLLIHVQSLVASLSTTIIEDQKADRSIAEENVEIDDIRQWISDIMKYDDDEAVVVEQFIEFIVASNITAKDKNNNNNNNNNNEYNKNSIREALHQERQLLQGEIAHHVFLIHVAIRDILYQRTQPSVKTGQQQHQEAPLSACRRLLSLYQQQAAAGINHQQLIKEMKEECQQHLTYYQDAMTATFELLFSRYPYPQLEQGLSMLHAQLLPLIQDIYHYLPHELKHMRARFAYYHFKIHQLSADIHQQMVDQSEAELRDARFPEDSLRIANAMVSQTQSMMQQLEEAIRLWQVLVDDYQYYGTDYVTADPHKEFVDISIRYGILCCQNGYFEKGMAVLTEAEEKQASMIAAYDTIRIATTSIMRQGRLTLGDIYVNMAVCLYDAQTQVYYDPYQEDDGDDGEAEYFPVPPPKKHTQETVAETTNNKNHNNNKDRDQTLRKENIYAPTTKYAAQATPLLVSLMQRSLSLFEEEQAQDSPAYAQIHAMYSNYLQSTQSSQERVVELVNQSAVVTAAPSTPSTIVLEQSEDYNTNNNNYNAKKDTEAGLPLSVSAVKEAENNMDIVDRKGVSDRSSLSSKKFRRKKKNSYNNNK